MHDSPIVFNLCAIQIKVDDANSDLMVRCTLASVSASTELVASSRMII